MHLEVGYGRTVCRLKYTTHLNIATQIGKFYNLRIKPATTGRLLITPIICLCT